MPETIEAPASNAIVMPTNPALITKNDGADKIKTPTEAFNLVGNAFDQIEQSLGIKPEPKPEAKPEEKKEAPKEVQKEQKSETTPEAKPEETKPENAVEEVIPGEQTPKAKMKWGELRKKADDHDRILPEYTKLKEEVENLRKGSQSEVETLKKQLQEFQQERESIEGELYLSRVQATKEYRQKVKEPYAKLLRLTEDIAESNKLDKNQILDLLHRGDRNGLSEILENLNKFDQGELVTIYRDFQEIQARSQEIEKNAKDAFEVSERNRKQEYDQYLTKLQESRTNEFKRLRPGLEAALKELPEEMKIDFEKLQGEVLQMDNWPEEFKVYAGASGAILPRALQVIKTQSEELEALREENSSLRNGAPKANGGNPATAPKEQKLEEDPKDSTDLAASIMSKLTFGQ